MIHPSDFEELVKNQQFQQAAWQKVIETARQYAMMEAFGSYIENGRKISVCHSDRERYASMFLDNLKWEAKRAFAEDAMLGASMHSARTVNPEDLV